MAAERRFTPLFTSPAVVVLDARCRSALQVCPEERVRAHNVLFTRSGVFVKRDRTGRTIAEPGSVMFLNEGEPFEVSHPGNAGHDCSLFGFDAVAVVEAMARFDARVVEEEPFRIGHMPVANLGLLTEQKRLRRALRDRTLPGLAAEERALGHGHFTRVFGRALSMSPSSFRRAVAARSSRQRQALRRLAVPGDHRRGAWPPT